MRLRFMTLALSLGLFLPSVMCFAEETPYEVDWSSQGKIEYGDSNGNVVLDASDFETIANLVAEGKRSIASVSSIGTTSSVPTFSTLSSNLQNKVSVLSKSMQVGDNSLNDIVTYAQSRDLSDKGNVVKILNQGETLTLPEGYYSSVSVSMKMAGGTATEEDIVLGETAWVNSAKLTGKMVPQTAAITLSNPGELREVTKGYYPNGISVTAASLTTLTEATADAADILLDKTAWVKGKLKKGSMPIQYGASEELEVGETMSLAQGYYPANFMYSAAVPDELIYTRGELGSECYEALSYLRSRGAIRNFGRTYHSHSNECYHKHSGDIINGGDCYTKLEAGTRICGSTVGLIADDETIVCDSCGANIRCPYCEGCPLVALSDFNAKCVSCGAVGIYIRDLVACTNTGASKVTCGGSVAYDASNRQAVCSVCRDIIECPECKGKLDGNSGMLYCRYCGWRYSGWKCNNEVIPKYKLTCEKSTTAIECGKNDGDVECRIIVLN